MHAHDAEISKLTKNQTLVLEALASAEEPMSAYAVLDRLRTQGFRAPPQVYRALDKLIELGLIHRVDSLNAFVACRQPDCEATPTIVFAICEDCGHVEEMAGETLSRQLRALARNAGFKPERSTVELRGLCGGCAP